MSLNIFSPSAACAESAAGAVELPEPDDPQPGKRDIEDEAMANTKSGFLNMSCNRRAAIPNKSTNANKLQQIENFCKCHAERFMGFVDA